MFEEPELVLVGKLEEVTGGGGHNNDDGTGYTKLASHMPLSV